MFYVPDVIRKRSVGSRVLTASWSEVAKDETWFGAAYFAMRYTYELSIDFNNTRDENGAVGVIIITQKFVIPITIVAKGREVNGNAVDREIIDTFELGIDENGRLRAKKYSRVKDNPAGMPTIWQLVDLLGVDSFMKSLQQEVRMETSRLQNSIPIEIVQDYVFPGGQTFIAKDIQFSDNQDLIASITYADQ